MSDIVKSYRSIFEASFIIITTKFLCLSLIFFISAVAAAALEKSSQPNILKSEIWKIKKRT